MILRRVPILSLALVVSACSSMDRRDEPTLRALKDRKVTVQRDGTIADSRAKAMDNYRQLLAAGPSVPMQAEAARRLADLKVEAGEEVAAGTSEPAGAEPQLRTDGAATLHTPAEYAEAISLYETLLRDHAARADNDRVLYQLARAYELTARPQQALAVLDRLVRDYPHSPYVPEAQFRRGELLFVAQDYAHAAQAYQAVVTHGEASEFFEQSLYKHGWALFKQSLHEEALDALFRLLDRKLGAGDAPEATVQGMGRADQELMGDTLRVISLSFSYESGVQSVSEYFRRAGRRPYEHMIYAALGDLYLDKERYTDAAATYHEFVASNSEHLQAPGFQMRVIETYRRGDFPSLVLEAKKEFVERYDRGGRFWQVHTPEQAPQVLAQLKSTLTDLSTHYHAQAQRTRTAADYDEAVRWYRGFMASFPHETGTPQVNFMLAELLFECKRHAAAAAEYERTAYEYGAHAKAADAGYAALLAHTEHERTLEPQARKAWHARAIESALRFAGTYPAHPQAAPVLARAAEDLYADGQHPRAVEVSAHLLARRPAPEAALLRTALTVNAHAHFDLGDFERAEAGYQRLLTLVPAQDEQRKALSERLAASVYKQGEQRRAAGELQIAVDHFLRVGRVAPDAGIRATAEYDAAAGLIELQDWARAVQVLERFRADHPQHELQGEVTRKLAVAYLESGAQGRAAAEFERMAGADGDAESRRAALWQAAELYAQAKDATRAAHAYGEFVRRFPQPLEQSIEARTRLADLQQAAGDTRAWHRTLGEIVQADRDAGAQRSTRTRFLAAHAVLTLAEPSLQAYRASKLELPLERSLRGKKRAMETALDAYGKAAAYEVAEVTTAATFQIAEIYHDFGRALMESQRPTGLSAEELEQYDLLLEEQAYPFEEKAIELHIANTGRAAQGIYDQWVRKSYEQLAVLLPVRYAKTEKGETHVAEIR